jgi:hypothetical protein
VGIWIRVPRNSQVWHMPVMTPFATEMSISQDSQIGQMIFIPPSFQELARRNFVIHRHVVGAG